MCVYIWMDVGNVAWPFFGLVGTKAVVVSNPPDQTPPKNAHTHSEELRAWRAKRPVPKLHCRSVPRAVRVRVGGYFFVYIYINIYVCVCKNTYGPNAFSC